MTCAALGSYMATSSLGKFIWEEWFPAVLDGGRIKFLPEPLVYGKGLDKVQGAIDRYAQGVSGMKVVVEID